MFGFFSVITICATVVYIFLSVIKRYDAAHTVVPSEPQGLEDYDYDHSTDNDVNFDEIIAEIYNRLDN